MDLDTHYTMQIKHEDGTYLFITEGLICPLSDLRKNEQPDPPASPLELINFEFNKAF